MKLLKLIPKKIYLFIVFPVVFSLILYIGGRIKTNPKEYERVNVLVSALNLNNHLLEEKISETNAVDVKEINVTFSLYNSDSMSLVYNTVFQDTDVFVFPKSFLDANIEANLNKYAKLTGETIAKYIQNPVFYGYEGGKFGVKVFDSATQKGWCDSIISYGNENFNEDYYMFFNRNSVNLGDIVKSDYDNALTFMKAMYEYEK